jgi:hypothetical protein
MKMTSSLAFLPDLYGNDEAEYSEQPEEFPKETSEIVPSAKETAPPAKVATSSKIEVVSPPSKVEPEALHVEDNVHDLQSLNAAQQSYDEPTTQQIPTYQERQEPEYHDPSAQLEGSFGMNRPVRPSEMKEEG